MKTRFKWLYPGIRLKRWVILLALSVLIFGIGLSGKLSGALTGMKLDKHISARKATERVRKFVIRLTQLKTVDLIALGVGGIGVYFALKRGIYAVATVIAPEKEKEVFHIFYERLKLKRGPRIVAMGGGTGLPVVLAGLKEYSSNISAVVTVADDGGSSGRLVEDFKILPPGDIRNCLVALADAGPLMEKLFQHRFRKSSRLEGHSFGNLFITALTEVVGDFDRAIKESSRILAIRGQVIPVTMNRVVLRAELADRTILEGQSRITHSEKPIEFIRLEPAVVEPTPEAIEAISRADIIIYGPGSLYTSIIPNLIVRNVVETILKSKAVKIYICNVMTQPGETNGYSAADHIRAIQKHTHPKIIDFVAVNTEPAPQELLEKYAAEGAFPVAWDEKEIENMGIGIIKSDLISKTNYVRHDPVKLSHCLMRKLSV